MSDDQGDSDDIYPPPHVSLSAEKLSHITSGQIPCLAMASPNDGYVKLRPLRRGLYETALAEEITRFQRWLDEIVWDHDDDVQICIASRQ